jgi:hypothetical protein
VCNELTERLDVMTFGLALCLCPYTVGTTILNISNCLETFMIAIISKHRICKNSVKLRTATHKDNMETEARLRTPEQTGVVEIDL